MEIKESKIINRDSSVVYICYPDPERENGFDDEVSLRIIRGSWKISDMGLVLALVLALCAETE